MSAILFDMDGTVIDSEPLWLEAEVEVMATVGYTWLAQDQINCLGGPMDRTEKYMQGKSKVAKHYGFFGELLETVMAEKLSSKLRIVPNAISLINECKDFGLPVALVTASTGKLMRAALSSFPENLFDITISADDVTRSKPDPECYELAANKLSVSIDKCVVFEDSKTGITSALASGAQVVAIPHLEEIPGHRNLRVINSLASVNLEQLFIWYPFLDTTRVRK